MLQFLWSRLSYFPSSFHFNTASDISDQPVLLVTSMAAIYPLLHLTPCTKAMQDEYIDSWLLGVRVDHDPCEDVCEDPDDVDLTGRDLGNRSYED